MSGYGTGYPHFFHCPVAVRNRDLDGRLPEGHRVVRTGRERPTPHNGKGHPRKLWTTYEYRCECGHVGWSSHRDMLKFPVTGRPG